ncbi:MAG TPA: hypothetical protein GXZ36_08365 [Firmicutes bacterium]|nr:hypothetical protein [Bacillota bacterium]
MKLYVTYVIGIITIISLGLTNLPLYKEFVRPIKIQVLDAFNDQPVANAVVYYRVETTRIKNLLGIPIIDPIYYRDVIQEKYVTDNDGFVDIPRHKVSLVLYEKIYLEYIYINLDSIEKNNNIEVFFKRPVQEGVRINPISYLKGVVLLSSKGDLNYDIYDSKNFTVISNERGLLKEAEEIIVQLERHDS